MVLLLISEVSNLWVLVQLLCTWGEAARECDARGCSPQLGKFGEIRVAREVRLSKAASSDGPPAARHYFLVAHIGL